MKFLNYLGAATVAAMLTTGAAHATQVFYEGFESGNSWSDGGGYGTVTIQNSGDNGVNAFEGSNYGKFEGSASGPYTFFDGARDTFPGTYTAQTAVYLDTNWALGSGFDFSVASSGSDGAHQRDFIFHVTKDTSTGSLLVGGSNNSNYAPREDLESINNYAVTQSGWYIFQHVFRNDGGTLAVDLNLLDGSMNTLFTETRTNAVDTIPGEVGGNYYGWFTALDVDNGIYVDATSLTVPEVPLPAGLPLLVTALGAAGFVARRKRG